MAIRLQEFPIERLYKDQRNLPEAIQYNYSYVQYLLIKLWNATPRWHLEEYDPSTNRTTLITDQLTRFKSLNNIDDKYWFLMTGNEGNIVFDYQKFQQSRDLKVATIFTMPEVNVTASDHGDKTLLCASQKDARSNIVSTKCQVLDKKTNVFESSFNLDTTTTKFPDNIGNITYVYNREEFLYNIRSRPPSNIYKRGSFIGMKESREIAIHHKIPFFVRYDFSDSGYRNHIFLINRIDETKSFSVDMGKPTLDHPIKKIVLNENGDLIIMTGLSIYIVSVDLETGELEIKARYIAPSETIFYPLDQIILSKGRYLTMYKTVGPKNIYVLDLLDPKLYRYDITNENIAQMFLVLIPNFNLQVRDHFRNWGLFPQVLSDLIISYL